MNDPRLENLEFKDGYPDLLSKPDYVDIRGIRLFPRLVKRREAGRMDLVAFDLYNDASKLYDLCRLNDIINEFGVTEGQLIFYPSMQELDAAIRISEEVTASQFLQEARESFSRNSMNTIVEPNKTRQGINTIIPGVKITDDSIKLG